MCLNNASANQLPAASKPVTTPRGSSVRRRRLSGAWSSARPSATVDAMVQTTDKQILLSSVNEISLLLLLLTKDI